MNRNIKRIISLTIASLTAAAVFSGCAKKENKEVNPTEAGNVSSTKLPIVDKPLTITMHQSMDSSISAVSKSYNDVKAIQELEKRTGIHIDFIHFTSSYDENVRLLISSRNLPDIFEYTWANYPGGPSKAISDDVLTPLNDLANKYAPNLKKYFEKDPTSGKLCKTDDGQIFMFPMSNGPEINQMAAGPQIRQDWLDKVGLKMPTNSDEWYNVLKAFKTTDMNGNGKADEIPLTADKNGVFDYLAYGMGLIPGWYQVDGKVKYSYNQPEFKELLKVLSKWYKEGLIDPDYMVNDSKTIQAKITGNRVGAWCDYISRMQTYTDLMKPTIPNVKIAGTPIPTLKAGEKPLAHHNQGTILQLRGAGISSTSKNKEAAVRLLDYLYSPEGSELVLWGIQGESYTKDSNGKIKVTDNVLKNPDKLPFANAMGKYALGFAKFIYVRDDQYMQYLAPMPEQQDALNTWIKAGNNRYLPPVQPSEADAAKFNTIMTDVDTYAKEMYNKFIMGNEPIDNFDKYISKLKELRIDEAIKIKQNAYDSFLKR